MINRRTFLTKSLLALITKTIAGFLFLMMIPYSTIGVLAAALLGIAAVVWDIKLVSQRLRDIAPNTDVGLLYFGFFLGFVLTGGLLGLGLYFVPSKAIGSNSQKEAA